MGFWLKRVITSLQCKNNTHGHDRVGCSAGGAKILKTRSFRRAGWGKLKTFLNNLFLFNFEGGVKK